MWIPLRWEDAYKIFWASQKAGRSHGPKLVSPGVLVISGYELIRDGLLDEGRQLTLDFTGKEPANAAEAKSLILALISKFNETVRHD